MQKPVPKPQTGSTLSASLLMMRILVPPSQAKSVRPSGFGLTLPILLMLGLRRNIQSTRQLSSLTLKKRSQMLQSGSLTCAKNGVESLRKEKTLSPSVPLSGRLNSKTARLSLLSMTMSGAIGCTARTLQTRLKQLFPKSSPWFSTAPRSRKLLEEMMTTRLNQCGTLSGLKNSGERLPNIVRRIS